MSLVKVLNMNTITPNTPTGFTGFMNGMLAGLFGTRHGRYMPAFMNERVLRDLGLLEPEEHAAHEPGEELANLASKNSALSIGMTGL